MGSPPDPAARAPEEKEYQSDDQQYDTDGPQNRDAQQEAEQETNESSDDHGDPSVLVPTVLVLPRLRAI